MEREALVGLARGLWEEATSPSTSPWIFHLHGTMQGEMEVITVIKTQRRKCPAKQI